MKNNFVIVTISKTHEEFAQAIAEYAGQKEDILTLMDPRVFSGKEFNPRFIFENETKNLQGKTVYLISTQGPFQNPQDMAMRIFITSRAAKENGAEKVVFIATDLSFSRQDRGINQDIKMLGEANTAKLYAELLQISGVDEIITIHLHSKQVEKYHNDLSNNGKQRIFDIWPSSLIAHYLLTKSSLKIQNNGENIVFISPDTGAKTFVEKVKKQMFLPNSSMLLLNKARKIANNPKKVEIKNPKLQGTNTLNGKTGIFFDDITDTGGTFLKVIDWLFNDSHSFGVLKNMLVYFSHPVMAGQSYEGIQNRISKRPEVKEFIVLDTRPFIIHNRTFRFKKNSTVLRTNNFFGDIIIRHNNGEDLKKSYIFSNKEKMLKTMKPLYKIFRSSRHFLQK